MTDMLNVNEKELKRAMKEVGINLDKDKSMLSKFIGLSSNLQLSPDDMALQWEVHALNTNVKELNQHTFQSFRTLLNSTRKVLPDTVTPLAPSQIKRGAVVHRPAMGRRSSTTNTSVNDSMDSPSNNKGIKRKVDFDSQLEHVVAKASSVTSPMVSNLTSSQSSNVVTPSKSASVSSSQSTSSDQQNAYANRKNAGEIILTYNPNNLDRITASASAETNVKITYPFGSLKPYKYMTDKDRSSALNSHLTSFQTKICDQIMDHLTSDQKKEMEENGETLVEFVGVPRQATQFNVGRICNEAHEGRMNKTTILLEGSKSGSNGTRIELDVSKMEKKFSLFPGQIVGVKGVNSSGRKMVVEDIVEGIQTQVVKTKKDELKEIYESSQGSSGSKIFAVAGPYTTNQNLNYEAFADLLYMVSEQKPAAVIMMGPFVDVRQQHLKDGDQVILEYEQDESEGGGIVRRHVSYETLFAAKISQELAELYDELPELNTKFILVPSLDDAITEPVFPQPPLADAFPNGGKIMKAFPETEEIPFGSLFLDTVETAGKRKMPKNHSERRVHLVSNPSTIKINEVTIGMTSTDTLLHLSTEEINQKLPPGTRLCRLAEHCIQQQSYYPIFPAQALPGMTVNLDINERSGFSMPVQPDILLMPSRLTCLAKDVSGGSVVINPGYLVKGAMGGSYAVIDIHPVDIKKLGENDDGEVSSDVKDRICVEIKKI